MGVLIRMAAVAGRLFRGRRTAGGASIARGAAGPIARTAAGVGAGVLAGEFLGDTLLGGGDDVPRRRRRRKALTNDDVKLALTIASAISKKAAENFILTRTRSA